MKPTLFISDLHLCEQRPDLTRAFLHFLEQQASQAQALYILGDLFEFWLGDDDDAPVSQTVRNALRQLGDSGVAVYFLHGNRDFLINRRFAHDTGCTLLDEESVIDLYGTPTLLMHGDTLCTDDVKYLEFRRKVRQPLVQTIYRLLPLGIRKKIFYKVKADSKASQQQKTAMIMDVTPEAVDDIMQKYRVNRLIHGHTHRPAIHPPAGRHGERIVLGDWDKLGWYLRVTANEQELKSFSID